MKIYLLLYQIEIIGILCVSSWNMLKLNLILWICFFQTHLLLFQYLNASSSTSNIYNILRKVWFQWFGYKCSQILISKIYLSDVARRIFQGLKASFSHRGQMLDNFLDMLHHPALAGIENESLYTVYCTFLVLLFMQ